MLEDLLFGSFGVGGPEQNDHQFWRKIWCERHPACTEEKLSVCCFQPIRFQDSMLFFIMWPADLWGVWVGSELWCYTELSLLDKNKNCRDGKPDFEPGTHKHLNSPLRLQHSDVHLKNQRNTNPSAIFSGYHSDVPHHHNPEKSGLWVEIQIHSLWSEEVTGSV